MRHLEVRVAYGTSKRTTTLHGGELTISSTSNRAAYDMAGLSYDTKFDLKRAVDLRLTPPSGLSFRQLHRMGRRPRLVLCIPHCCWRCRQLIEQLRNEVAREH